MDEAPHPDSITRAAGRIADLLSTTDGGAFDAGGRDLVYEKTLELQALQRLPHPGPVIAVDGGQALVADARCLQLYVTRAAMVAWEPEGGVSEEVGPLQAHLLGLGEDRRTLAEVDAPVDPGASVDVNLLRDWAEWSLVARCVRESEPGTMVMVDGDLQPDWRIRSGWLADLLTHAERRGIVLVGVTKHSSLAWGGAPLLAVLERLADERSGADVGPRSLWWAAVGRTREDVSPGIQVVVARLDPDARYSFRVDLPGYVDAVTALGKISSLCDDAAFPGYPYPLSVADRLAACPGWLREETWSRVDTLLDEAGVMSDVRERAFADRHRLMERG